MKDKKLSRGAEHKAPLKKIMPPNVNNNGNPQEHGCTANHGNPREQENTHTAGKSKAVADGATFNLESVSLTATVVAACAGMAAFEILAEPSYPVKSAVKIALFMIFPLIWATATRYSGLKRLFIPSRRGFLFSLGAGIAVFAAILAAYFIVGGYFDLSGITKALAGGAGVTRENFIFVAAYISFVNSLLEEFFFRGFAYMTLAKTLGARASGPRLRAPARNIAGCFSAAAFALYHVSMMIGWFNPALFALVLGALFAGGLIFNYFNDRFGNIYMSWMIHMFANFAINTIGFILFAQ